MLTIETKELNISEELKKKVDMICEFAYGRKNTSYALCSCSVNKEV